MVVRMVCQLVSVADDALQRLRPARGIDAVDKEGRVDAPLGKAVKQLARVFAGAVIKGDRPQLRTAVLHLRRADRQRQRGRKQQSQQQR